MFDSRSHHLIVDCNAGDGEVLRRLHGTGLPPGPRPQRPLSPRTLGAREACFKNSKGVPPFSLAIMMGGWIMSSPKWQGANDLALGHCKSKDKSLMKKSKLLHSFR
ncbi:hypothetical protein PVAP13_9KG556901 [Panicum virgatum]|uniref:Uncharacterized protein n=1 Tax=Panicum virgatum TaxID=38727 RepID=A0A8T0NZM3_PANVG|nr:hypothetical protein PVAP13_9KG556901 [Panicum virgatum]KAG2555391.1 hypothetical protein PVAP13_9KG556901 [Panicum virgatum]